MPWRRAGAELLDMVNSPDRPQVVHGERPRQLAYELRWNDARGAATKTGTQRCRASATVRPHVFAARREPTIIWDVRASPPTVPHKIVPTAPRRHKILTGAITRCARVGRDLGLHAPRRSRSTTRSARATRRRRSRRRSGWRVGGEARGRRAQRPIAVIGDGAITGGMAYEAMNNAAVPQLARDRDLQ